jgi:hypothetical protein
MRVIPECSRLVRSSKVVEERVSRGDGALIDALRAVCPARTALEKTMPVNRSALQHGSIRELILNVNSEPLTLIQECQYIYDLMVHLTHTLFAVMTGPGKDAAAAVAPATTVL